MAVDIIIVMLNYNIAHFKFFYYCGIVLIVKISYVKYFLFMLLFCSV